MDSSGLFLMICPRSWAAVRPWTHRLRSTVGLPDADRDALVEADDAPPHPVDTCVRTPNRSAKRIELVSLPDPSKACTEITITFARTLTKVTAAATLIAVVVAPLPRAIKTSDHIRENMRSPRTPMPTVQATTMTQVSQSRLPVGNPARVALVSPQAVTGEGETAV